MINILKLRKLEKEKSTDKKASSEEFGVNDEAKVKDTKPVEPETLIQETIDVSDKSEAIIEKPEQKQQKKTGKKNNDNVPKKNTGRKRKVEEPITDDNVKSEILITENNLDSDAEVKELLGEINEIEKELIELQEETYNEEKNEEAEVDPAEILRANLLKELLEEENKSAVKIKEVVESEEITEPVKTEKPVEEVKSFEISKPVETAKPIEISKPAIENTVVEKKEKYIEIEKPVPQYITKPQEENPIRQISNIVSSIQKDESLLKGDLKKKNNENIVQLVGFMLSNEYYGVDIMKIREIIRMVDITRVPRAPHFIEGVINLRGTVIPVINLRTKVRMPRLEYDKNTRIVIVEISGTIVGFIVDAVREVLRIQENCLEAPPAITIERADYITSVAKLEDQLVILMDTEKVLSNEEGKLLGDMTKNK